MAPEELQHCISELNEDDKRVLVGLKHSDDASVYKLGKFALVQTLDFITPIVDEPYTFGQIAAANSLSDVFAMNAKVLNALNIVGYDNCNLNSEILKEILQGGFDKVKESGGFILGGHTIQNSEMFYGLSVTGKTKVKNIWRNNTPKVGDVLILTKPIGTGIISTALKANLATSEDAKEICSSMTRLNMYARNVLKKFKISACTDITGFGLLGHAKEMSRDDITIVLNKNDISFFKNVFKYANEGLIPEGSYKNYDFVKNSLKDENINLALCDAQTSGGLLVAIDEKDASKALKRLQENGDENASIIGFVKKREKKALEIIS